MYDILKQILKIKLSLVYPENMDTYLKFNLFEYGEKIFYQNIVKAKHNPQCFC